MQRRDRYDYSQLYLEPAYKELHIPPGRDGAHVLEKNALHIWPRGGFMMMAMANRDGSFTITLYLPVEGPFGFDRLGTPDAVRRFFEEQFPDAVPHLPTLLEDFFANPTGSLLTIRSRPWHAGGTAVLLGDAAHAIVPFYGQGANAAFEDCLTLLDRLRASPGDVERAFRAYETERKPNAEAIADLALENFREMRDHVASPLFLARKRLEKLLHTLLPRQFLPLYGMIAFSLIPYAEAKARAERQGRVMRWIAVTAGLALILLAVVWLW